MKREEGVSAVPEAAKTHVQSIFGLGLILSSFLEACVLASPLEAVSVRRSVTHE